MSRNYSVTVDVRALRSLRARLDKLSPASMARVQKRAIGTVRRRVGPVAAQLLGEDLNLPKSKIRNRLRVDGGPDYVAIHGSSVGIPLAEFGATWGGPKSRGVVAKVFRDAAPRTYAGSFIARTSGKKAAVYERAWRGGRRTGKRYGRLPVQHVRGPNVGSLLIATGPHQVAGRLIAFASQVLASELSRLLDIEER